MGKKAATRSGVSRRDFLKIAAISAGAGGAVFLGTEAKVHGETKKLRLTLACTSVDRFLALRTGEVGIEGVDLNVVVLPTQEVFWRQLRYMEFDASEISFSSYVLGISRGDDRFIAIPAFTSRRFRHSCVYINTHKGIKKPEDLKGRTVGVAEYQMTAGLWLRGIFQHEYGVRPQDVKWRTGGEEMPGREEKLELKLPPDIDCAPIPSHKTLSQMLDAGEIDALFTAGTPSPFRKGSPNVKRLWDNWVEAEAEYFKKTGIFPIMHAVAIKRSVYKENPWIAQSLYKALLQAKDMCLKNFQYENYSVLPWLGHEAERTRKIMGQDYYPYGVDKNRKVIEAVCQYSYEQGLAGRKVDIKELFAPETFDEFKI